MSTTMRESSHVTRKYVTHGTGAISGHGQSGNTSSNTLENNLDALLEDLQTSVSRSATPNRGGRPRSPQIEYRSAANSSKTVSEIRSISPTRSKTTTTEKYVSTGPVGVASGIPGLEALDAELRNVQPGQSKTVAYKQVSYAYKKDLDGKPIDSYALSDNSLTTGGMPLVEDIHEVSYDERNLHRRHHSPEPVVKTSTVNRELLFDDSYTSSRSKQTSPLPGSGSRDLKFVRESSKFQTDVRPSHNQTINTREEYGNVDYIPVPSPSPALPINLAPGPNTKVTTTVKTYTYELPGAPETYLPATTNSTTLQKNVHLAGDQTITYTLPRGSSLERPASPLAYPATHQLPPEVTQKSKILHKEAKYYQEEIHGYPTTGKCPTTTSQPSNETTITRNDYYRQTDGSYTTDHGWRDRTDYPGNSTTTVIYQNQQPPTAMNETRTTTTIDRIEEHYPNSPISNGRPDHHRRPGSPTRIVNYYGSPSQPPPPQTNTTIYKYSNMTTVVPPNGHHPEDREVLLPKPFPTGIQLYPSNDKPSGVTNGQGPPAKLEDLMASFSDSEREVLDDIAKQENYQRKNRANNDTASPKKEVDFVPHTPPQVQSKNVAGPPVYYPPGSAEFTKKESAEGAMSQSAGGWQKASGKYEYEASSKSKSKTSSGKAVVPVCLPLCCALPCVIM